jgi:carbonic anhydrase
MSFEDLLRANADYQARFHDPHVAGRARRKLAVLTCIDSRIDPLAMLGLHPGDAKILRNAGARVTDDALRSLVLAVNLLDVERVCVVQHTDCAMAGRTDSEIRDQIHARTGGWVEFDLHSMLDQQGALRDDLARIRDCAFIPPDTIVGGFMFDVTTGALAPAS